MCPNHVISTHSQTSILHIAFPNMFKEVIISVCFLFQCPAHRTRFDFKKGKISLEVPRASNLPIPTCYVPAMSLQFLIYLRARECITQSRSTKTSSHTFTPFSPVLFDHTDCGPIVYSKPYFNADSKIHVKINANNCFPIAENSIIRDLPNTL
jgi:hypothetical protein